MTNASVKNRYFVLLVAGVLVLSLGVFARIAHAQDFIGDDGSDGSGDFTADDSYSNFVPDDSYSDFIPDDSSGYGYGCDSTCYDSSSDFIPDDSSGYGCDSSCYS